MNIDINLPQVSLLRNAVDEKLGATPKLPSDFAAVADKIRLTTGERLSPSTMERFWKYSTRNNNNIAEHTLDVLARYVGYKNWGDFECTTVNTFHQDSGFISGEIIDINDLRPGMIIRLSWLPNRVLKVRYCGNNRFVVESSEHSSITPGDSFECLAIQKGQPLYLDRFHKATDKTDSGNSRYVTGRNSGLTDVAIFSE